MGTALSTLRAGSRLRYAHPKYGYPYDQQVASRHLEEGGTYTVERLRIEPFNTDVWFEEVPGVSFNIVLFEHA